MIDISSFKDPVALVVGSLGVAGCSVTALQSVLRRGTNLCCGKKPTASFGNNEIGEGGKISFSIVRESLADTTKACALFVCVLLVLSVASSPSNTVWEADADFVLVFESLAMFAFGVYLLRRSRKRLDKMLNSQLGEIASENSSRD